MKGVVAKRTVKEFLFGEDFSSWYVPEVSKVLHSFNKEVKKAFYETVRRINEDGVAIEDAWEDFAAFYSQKHSEYAKKIKEAKRLQLIIPFYGSNVLKRIAMKFAESKYATMKL